MLVCTIELWPGGNQEQARELGCVEIENVGGDLKHGDYAVKLSKARAYTRQRGNWKVGSVTKFPRQRLGAYDLLLRALANVIGDRNRKALKEANAAYSQTLEELDHAAS